VNSTQKILDQWLALGLKHHQSGAFDQAQALYEKILQSDPNHLEALQLSARLAGNQRAFNQSLDLWDRAIKVSPEHPNLHYQRALTLQALGQLKAAIPSFIQSLSFNKNQPLLYFNLAIALQDLNELQGALDAYQLCLCLEPDNVMAYHNRGIVLQGLKKGVPAVLSFNQALLLNHDSASAHNHLGNALTTLEQYPLALDSYNWALTLNPHYAQAHNNKGIALQRLKRWPEALVSFNQAILLQANFPQAYNNQGITLRLLGQWDESLASYNRAITLNPQYIEAYNHRGYVLQLLSQWEAAFNSYQQAIHIDQHYAEAHWNRGLLQLQLGDFIHGWPSYEWRWQRDNIKPRPHHPASQLWLGELPLNGRSIKLFSEQGLGDAIQFCRYAPLVALLGAKVTLEVHESLVGFMKNLDGITVIANNANQTHHEDFHCPLLSLPLCFKTTLDTIPAPDQNLCAETEKILFWQNQLGSKTKPRIGLAWSGNPTHENDHFRSLALKELCTYLPPEFDYFCVQKDYSAEDAVTLTQHPLIRPLGVVLHDFTDTAALVSCMDLIISVDTSIAHLSASLGLPTWILLPFHSEWRWLNERNDSPWYPSATLYRQSTHASWAHILQTLRHDLLRMLDQPSWTDPASRSGHIKPQPLQPVPDSTRSLQQQLEAVEQRIRHVASLPSNVMTDEKTHTADRVAHGFERGSLLTLLGREEEAKAQFLAVLREDETHLGTLINFAVLLANTGYPSAAKTAYRQALKHHPEDPLIHVNLGHLLFDEQNYSEAKKQYEEAIQALGDTPLVSHHRSTRAQAHQGLAQVFYEQGQSALAEEHRQKGYEQEPLRSYPYSGKNTPKRLLILIAGRGGDLPYSGLLTPELFESQSLAIDFYVPPDPNNPQLPVHDVILNAIGDADTCSSSLHAAHRWLNHTTSPVINPPTQVLKSGRYTNAQRLGKLSGVRSAKMVLMDRSHFISQQAFTQALPPHFDFPLLIRSPGFQGGKHFEKVDDIQSLLATATKLPGSPLWVMEYLPAADALGNFRKYRVMLIDHQIYPLHLAISKHWKVHYFSAAMKDNPLFRKEEEAFLLRMPEVLGQNALKALYAIEKTLALDYAGIDFSIDPEGNIILFEANATMIISPPAEEPLWAYRQQPILRARRAAQQLLASRCGI